jgi:survival of motor neuron-related-splicing factor 30
MSSELLSNPCSRQPTFVTIPAIVTCRVTTHRFYGNMSVSLASLEDDRSQYQEQLGFVLASLKDDPDNAELLSLKEELDTAVQMLDESIEELKPKRTEPKAIEKPPPPPPKEEKWSRENHPAFKKTDATPALPPAEEEQQQQVAYAVNDTVLAKWISGDKGFYPARIMGVTGSRDAPIYTVKFKSYDTVETLRARDIRPVAAQKRKAEGAPGTASSSGTASPAPVLAGPAAPGGNGVITNVAASLYPQQADGKDGATASGEQPAKKFKKIKAKKELEAGKSKWQEFSNKSKFGKNNKKDSMFRTPDGVRGRGTRLISPFRSSQSYV